MMYRSWSRVSLRYFFQIQMHQQEQLSFQAAVPWKGHAALSCRMLRANATRTFRSFGFQLHKTIGPKSAARSGSTSRQCSHYISRLELLEVSTSLHSLSLSHLVKVYLNDPKWSKLLLWSCWICKWYLLEDNMPLDWTIICAWNGPVTRRETNKTRTANDSCVWKLHYEHEKTGQIQLQ